MLVPKEPKLLLFMSATCELPFFAMKHIKSFLRKFAADYRLNIQEQHIIHRCI